jgi:hypothetical protein
MTNQVNPQYRMIVRVDPSLRTLEAEVWIEQPPRNQFYIHKNFHVSQVDVDRASVSFHQEPTVTGLPYTRETSQVSIDVKSIKQLHVIYCGEMKDTIFDVNLISPDLVELSWYSAWYPLFEAMGDFNFNMEVNIPDTFQVVTNFKLIQQRKEENRLISTWTSYHPGGDMVLIASPHLDLVKQKSGEIHVEMYYRNLPSNLMNSLMDSMMKGMERLSDFYGLPKVPGLLRFIYSPRSGWGYSRIPLFILSEEFVIQRLSMNFGEARIFHGNCHELAHFWWLIANSATTHDWINEGLAEFSAFRLSEAFYGHDFTEVLIQEYQQLVKNSQTTTCIAETSSSSPDLFVNRYIKTQ